MELAEKLEKIEKEIEKGLKFKSADRLRNLINEYPNKIEIWERLAELYFEGGFFDAAGRYWILTEPKESRIKNCVEIYEKSVGNSGTQILNEITFRGDKEKLSEYAKKKLTELENDSKKKSNYIPKFSPKLNKSQKKNSQRNQTLTEKIIQYILIALVIITPILAIIGFIKVIEWIF